MPQTAQLIAPPGDIELVRAFQSGSVEAFDQLFVRYHHAITGLTTRLVRDPLLAEDLTQETFYRVLRSLERVDQSFNFSAWVHRIATNLCYDELRRRKHRPATEAEGTHAPASIEDPDGLVGRLPNKDMTGNPQEALATSELRREVWEVAAQLPQNYRTVIILRELQGLSYASIAQAMGLSEAAIETLLHRARRRFKAEYLYLGFVTAGEDESCDSLRELLSSAGLQRLQRNQRTRVTDHLDQCVECQIVMKPTTARPEPILKV